MAPVVRELATDWGVLEPLQTATSVAGQTDELRAVLIERAALPVTLIGWSWGAMLGYILAAHYPAMVAKLIMVGSGVYEEQYAAGIEPTRLSRLDEAEKREARSLMASLNNPAVGDKAILLARLGEIFTKADSYHPLTLDSELLEVQYHVYHSVWAEVLELRRSGQLLALGKQIQCPVVAVHGDYDPHPAAGVHRPLAAVVRDFRFIRLRQCGHQPWIEREARDKFFSLLREELHHSS